MSQQCGTSEIKIGRGDSIQGGLTDGACKNYATHKDHVVYVYIKISILKNGVKQCKSSFIVCFEKGTKLELRYYNKDLQQQQFKKISVHTCQG